MPPHPRVPSAWEFAHDVPQTFGPQPDPDAVVAHVDALHEEAHKAGLLSWKQLVPDAVEVGERLANRVLMQASRADRSGDYLGSSDQAADLLDHGLVDRAGWHPPDRSVILAALKVPSSSLEPRIMAGGQPSTEDRYVRNCPRSGLIAP